MATQNLATLSSASSCSPFPSSCSRLRALQASPFYIRSLQKAFSCRGTASFAFEPVEAHFCGRRLWKAEAPSFGSSLRKPHAIESCDMPSDSASDALKQSALLLYRALLVVGIGLSLTQASAVHAAAAPVSVTVAKDSSNGKQKAAEQKDLQETKGKDLQESRGKDLQESRGKEAAGALGEEFWNGLDLARGSDELILKQVLDRDPSNVSALECLARTLMDDDDLSHALLVLEKLECLQPNELEWKLMKADAYDLNGKSEAAKEIFEDILKTNPYSSRALQGLILAMDQLDQSDSAMKILEDTWTKAKQENNHVETQNFGMLIGQVHMFKGRMQEALQHYNKMIEEDPSDFRPYLHRGIIYCVTGEMEKADDSFENFEKLCPEELESREVLEGMKARARKEGQRIYESKQRHKAKVEQKGQKKKK